MKPRARIRIHREALLNLLVVVFLIAAVVAVSFAVWLYLLVVPA